METLLQYRGRRVTHEDASFIRALIEAHPSDSRRALSRRLCEAWGWLQPNGHPRDMVCRGLMLALHRAGHIVLPPIRHVNPNPLARRRRPLPIEADESPIETSLSEMGPLDLRQIRRTPEEAVFNALVEAHHYLGYTQPVGEHLKYIAYAGGRPVACMAWGSAPRHLGPRDRFIGWPPELRKQNIRFIAYNSRYLILPWVRVPHLASHLLGTMVRRLPREWDDLYGHPVHFAETFVYPDRFRGTCYRAANWIYLGQTTGRGKDDQTHRPSRPIKDVLGYPLTRNYRARLCEVR